MRAISVATHATPDVTHLRTHAIGLTKIGTTLPSLIVFRSRLQFSPENSVIAVRMSAMLLSAQTCARPVVGRAPALHRARSFRLCRPQYNRNVVMMAERPIQDDNPAEKAAAQVEDKLEGFVQQTKENSGLFQDTISQQPGNRGAGKGSPIDDSGKAGGARSTACLALSTGVPTGTQERSCHASSMAWYLIPFRWCRGHVPRWASPRDH